MLLLLLCGTYRQKRCDTYLDEVEELLDQSGKCGGPLKDSLMALLRGCIMFDPQARCALCVCRGMWDREWV